MQKLLKICLCIMAFAFTAIAFAGGAGDFAAGYGELREGNSGGIGLTAFILALRVLTNSMAYVLDAILAVKAMELLTAMTAAPYGDGTVEKGEKLYRFAINSLVVVVNASMLLNVVQAALIKKLLSVDVQLVIPVFSIAFMLAAVLLSRLIRENKNLKDDNDMFI